MKKWHPEAWKPLNIKPVEVSELPNENIREEHSFLGTRKVDRNSNNHITSFADNFMGGVRKPYRTSHEHAQAQFPYANLEEESRVAKGRIAGYEAEEGGIELERQ